jgi:hypothetical protein
VIAALSGVSGLSRSKPIAVRGYAIICPAILMGNNLGNSSCLDGLEYRDFVSEQNIIHVRPLVLMINSPGGLTPDFVKPDRERRSGDVH